MGPRKERNQGQLSLAPALLSLAPGIHHAHSCSLALSVTPTWPLEGHTEGTPRLLSASPPLFPGSTGTRSLPSPPLFVGSVATHERNQNGVGGTAVSRELRRHVESLELGSSQAGLGKSDEVLRFGERVSWQLWV